MMKNIAFFIFFLFSSSFLFGQNFRYASKLSGTDSTGFFKIQIVPQINSKLQPGFDDLRLFDIENKEVPYILKEDNPVTYTSTFHEYEITGKKFLKDSVTQIILRNNRKENINNISLVIRNAEVQKEMRLSGSFDSVQWFTVKESFTISSISNQNDIAETKPVNFPLNNYTFYRIEINDKYSAPVDVIKAGYYESTSVNGAFTELKSSLVISDSAKQKTTWLRLTFEEPVYINAIELKITGPEYYLRSANIYLTDDRNKSKISLTANITIDSKSPLHYNIDEIKSKEIWLEIFNEDNSPLKISGVKCLQRNHYCIARLEKSKQYELRFGDSLLQAPRYDLKYFQSVIPGGLTELTPGSIVELKQAAAAQEPKSFFTDKRFIWIALVIVIFLLGFVTYKMMGDFRK
jgi:hypothetical protein